MVWKISLLPRFQVNHGHVSPLEVSRLVKRATVAIRLRLLASEGEWVVEPLGYRRLEYTTNCKYALSGRGCLDSLNVCHLNGPFPCSNGSG